jgi:hypothetical protein
VVKARVKHAKARKLRAHRRAHHLVHAAPKPKPKRRHLHSAAARAYPRVAKAVAPAISTVATKSQSGSGIADAFILALVVISLLALLAAAVPARLVSARFLALTDRRSDLATAGVMGLLSFALAYVVSKA